MLEMNKILKLYDFIEAKIKKLRPINVMLFICFILSYPNYVAIIGRNLDPSWLFFLNYSWSNDIVFGKDAFFTYGPLGWLIHPQNLGNNLTIGFIFWNVVWGLFGYSLYITGKLFVESRENYIAATIACLAYIFCGIVSGDIFLVYIELLMLTLIIRGQQRFLFPFIALYVVLFLMKFSSFYIVTSAILVYCVFSILFKISNRKNLLILISSFPLCLITYLVYNPSLYNLVEYIEAAVHISMGMNSAMSTINTEGPEWTILFVPLIALGLIFYAFHFFRAERRSALVYLTLISSFFFFYKEGFVRHGGSFAFLSCSLVFSLILLNINWTNTLPKFGHRSFSIFLIAVLGLCFIYPHNSYNVVYTKYQKIRYIVGQLKSARQDKGSNASHLPESFVSTIKDSTFGVFPWELSYAANTKNFVNMPVFQNYTVYTPWLDEKNQKFFDNPLNAPEYIVFDGYTIDGRWPFIETPRTFRSILENYHVEKKEGNQVLLKRNEKKINIYGEPIVIRNEIIKGEYIAVPQEATFFSIKAKPSIVGNLVKVLWKIPEVNLTVEYENNKERSGRVVTDNLDYLYPVNYLGINPFLQRKNHKIKKLKLSGRGARLLNDCEITFYKGDSIPSLVSHFPHNSNINLSEYIVKDAGSSIKFNIDEFYSEDKNAQIRGWAFFVNKDIKAIDVGYDVFIQTDKGMFNVTYSDRRDVVNHFNLNILDSKKIGFSADVPVSSFYRLVFLQKNFKTALTRDISNHLNKD